MIPWLSVALPAAASKCSAWWWIEAPTSVWIAGTAMLSWKLPPEPTGMNVIGAKTSAVVSSLAEAREAEG